MSDNYKKLIGAIPGYRTTLPTEQISTMVLARIEHRQIVLLRVRTGIHSLVGLSAAAGIVFVAGSVSEGLVRSGFFEYLSLIASDGAYLSGHWNTLLLSMADALPVTGGILLFGGLLIFIDSARRTARYASSLSAMSQHSHISV